MALYPEAPRRPPAVRDQRHPALVRNYLRLRDHLGDPLFRNAYALMVNTGVTGLLGVTYWLLAARHYAVADVGRASAAYTAMNLLAGFTALNLTGALTRFIPQSGRRTAAFIIRAYAGSCVASVVVAIPFLLTVRHWGSSYAELAGSATGLIFIACVVTWSIFTLQDGVLTGLRSAIWIPFENGLFGIVKIVLLVSLAVAIPHSGIYVSWMLPVAVSLPLINILIFGRLVPRHAAATSRRAPPTGRQIRRFLAGDYTGALCVLATTTLVPVTVALRIDPGMYAYFYMAWMIGSTLDLFAVNMATSLTVEGAFDAARLAVNCRAALRKIMLILVPIAGALALISPWALGLFGPNYAEHGARILELLAAAALPKALTEVYLGALRAQSRTSLIALIQGVRCILVLGLALGLTGLVGIVGAAMAVLASQAIVAVMITPGLRRILAGARRAPLPLRPEGRYLLSVEPLSVGSAGSPEQETVTAGGLGGREASPPQASTPVVQQAVQPEEPVTEVAAARSRIRIMRPGWLPVAALCALAAAGLALFFLPLRGVSLSRMTGLGLISVLPAASLIGVGMLTLAFVLALGLPRARPAVLGAMLVGIVICLDGVTAIIEPEPRFATAYQIAGFVEYISRTGHSAPGVGAYFSWPGFFALVAFLQGVAGNHDLIPVLRFWPVLIDLLCLLPLFLIMRNLRATWRARWFAAFLFSAGNWVGQDYFSPQAFNFLLYLVFVAILLTWFGRVPRGARAPDGRAPDGRAPDGRAAGPAGNAAGLGRAIRRRWRDAFSLLVPGELPSRPVGGATRAMLLTLLIGIFVISTASHQLTPFFMVTACAGLVAARRCRLTGLPVLLGVILVGWVSFAAVGYWSGHLSDIFGGIGHLGANITSSVTGRVSGPKAGGTSPSHRPVAAAQALGGR